MAVEVEQTTLARGGATSVRADAQGFAERYRAPFSLRCGAMLIDYVVIVGIVAFSTVFARVLGGGARMAGGTSEVVGLAVALAAALLDFLVLPALRAQTLGKWATGLRISKKDGGDAGAVRVILRNTLGYLLSLLTLGLGFLLAVFSPKGRALHDLVAGTVVTRGEPRARKREVRSGNQPGVGAAR